MAEMKKRSVYTMLLKPQQQQNNEIGNETEGKEIKRRLYDKSVPIL